MTCAVSATPETFGIYDPTTPVANDTASASVSVSCSSSVSVNASYSIALSAGSGGSYASRGMLSGGSVLAYQLYTDITRTQIWGDGSAGTRTPTDSYLLAVVASVTHSYTVYGRIPARQSRVAPGSYTDTILVTLTY